MSTEEAIGLVIFIEIVVGIALLIWALINNYMYRSITHDRHNYEERVANRKKEYRKIESVKVIFRDGGTSEFKDAKSYSFDYDVYSINDNHGKALALLERKEVSAVIIKRVGDKEDNE